MKEEIVAKRILLINDMPGYGKVALAAMTPVLSGMGHYIYQLPTALISNTLDFGKYIIQDMTQYMKETILVWEELGFDPDCICTGFLVSSEQAEFLREYILTKKSKKVGLVLVDPIMGDGGRLYNGVGTERVEAMRQLASVSDVMVPNITEASFLTNCFDSEGKALEQGTAEQIRALLDGLHGLSGNSAVITSVVETGTKRHLVCGYDHNRKEYFQVDYEYLPVRIAGSGDIFSAVLTGELLRGKSLQAGVKKAVRILSELIRRSEGSWENYKGLLIEKHWDVFTAIGSEEE